MKLRLALVLVLSAASIGLVADEGMWRFDQLPVDVVAKTYGVKLGSGVGTGTPSLLAAPMR